jgi:metal-responsive CopG/Arc/MetJ family transcriptional regulator
MLGELKMVKVIVEIPDELILNIDDIKEQIDYKTREDFIVAAIKRFLDIYKIRYRYGKYSSPTIKIV